MSKLKNELRPLYMKYYESNIDERLTDTDASETGILKLFEKFEEIELVRKRYPQHFYNNVDICIPFNSKLKFACFLRQVPKKDNPNDYTFCLAFKGAPEQLIKRCNRYLQNGQEIAIDQKFHDGFQVANKTFALKGERIIGLAYTHLEPGFYHKDYPFEVNNEKDEPIPNFPITNLCFVGLLAMEDPPRPGVKEAIQICNEAGIKVIMVTGDQTLTAASIAYQIGIIKDLDDAPEIIKDREKLSSIEDAERRSNVSII
jgi:sodium/potassium-transporting ATPase subunit alpha